MDAQAEGLWTLLLPTARDSARVALQAKGEGTGWKQVPPHPGLGKVMPHSDYQLGLRWWLGLPLQPSLDEAPMCPKCHAAALDPFGDHLVCCRQNNFTARHGALQDAFLMVLGLAKQPAEREQALQRTNSSRVIRQQLRPADILLRNWAGGRDVAVDLTIVHPLQVGEIPWSAERAKGFLRRKEAAKNQKYEDPCRQEGWGFLPMAFSTCATAGPKTISIASCRVTWRGVKLFWGQETK